VFTARYALSPYIKQISFVFKGLNNTLLGLWVTFRRCHYLYGGGTCFKSELEICLPYLALPSLSQCAPVCPYGEEYRPRVKHDSLPVLAVQHLSRVARVRPLHSVAPTKSVEQSFMGLSKIPRIFWNPIFHYHIHKSLPLFLSLNHTNAVCAVTSHFNIILLPTPKYSSCSVHHQNSVVLSLLPNSYYMIRSSIFPSLLWS
jgi:hypothetical protein